MQTLNFNRTNSKIVNALVILLIGLIVLASCGGEQSKPKPPKSPYPGGWLPDIVLIK
jgi:hypothetical protein